MASLRQEHHYGLSCGKNNRKNSNRTLYHVKLTDSALRALEAFQNIKGSSHCQPSICFKGSQGYIKIPAPTPDTPSSRRVFTFYLSSDSKDQPQASFDCIHQYISSDGHEQLEGQGIIQDKITVCATDDSYQTTRERLSQVEKDSWNRSVIEIKPGATQTGWSTKFNKRPVSSLPASDSSPLKQPARWGSGTTVSGSKPLRERIIHLLALKPYRKPELLVWLERERASPKDKAELGAILDEVAKVNPKDNSYHLQDSLYKNVQKDWPGYSEEDKQLIGRVLSRKLSPNSCQLRNLQTTTSVQKTTEDTVQQKKSPVMKHPLPLDTLDKIAAKRQKLITKRLQQQPVALDQDTPPLVPSFSTKTEFQRTCNHTENHNNSPEPLNSIPHMHMQLSGTSDTNVIETEKQEIKVNSALWTQEETDSTNELLTNNQHKKKKSKKHKEKDRDRLKDKQSSDWLEASPDLKQNVDKLDNPDIKKTEEKLDYVLMYSTIMNLEQRQRYQADFCAEYDEYKDLHSRFATITHMFVQLGSKIKSLPPGTKEHKMMEDQILEKYNKYKKKFPGYREEKKRCEYLHEKLSYIKQLITDYDISQASL